MMIIYLCLVLLVLLASNAIYSLPIYPAYHMRDDDFANLIFRITLGNPLPSTNDDNNIKVFRWG